MLRSLSSSLKSRHLHIQNFITSVPRQLHWDSDDVSHFDYRILKIHTLKSISTKLWKSKWCSMNNCPSFIRLRRKFPAKMTSRERYFGWFLILLCLAYFFNFLEINFIFSSYLMILYRPGGSRAPAYTWALCIFPSQLRAAHKVSEFQKNKVY